MKILVTGAAGFIGYHLSERLCKSGWNVIGIDSMSNYYDISLKEQRIKKLEKVNNFQFIKLNLCQREELNNLIKTENFDFICNLAAQAGVRYSIADPYTYVDSNIMGFLNLLESIVHYGKCPLIYASSSSIYGDCGKQPFSEDMKTDTPVSLYAATKKSDELMAYVYSHMYGISVVGLRFFTVYGPWGRPDMAYFKFAEKISAGKAIDVYNYGKMRRDFTYVDDITVGIEKILLSDFAAADKFRIYNIGRGKPELLMDFIRYIEDGLGLKAELNMLPMQAGDVVETFADVSKLKADFGYCPSIDLKEGISRFIEWYKGEYQCRKQ